MSILCRSLAFVFAKFAANATLDMGLLHIVINPWYWAELGALVGQAVFWMYVLRHMPLSVAYPTTSLVYGLNLFWAAYLFGEKIAPLHVIGFLLIMTGIILTKPAKREIPR